MKLLTIENGTKVFGGIRALDNVNFDLKAGERRAIIGPNGAGKTTLFNLISGMFKPTAGRIRFLNKDISAALFR